MVLIGVFRTHVFSGFWFFEAVNGVINGVDNPDKNDGDRNHLAQTYISYIRIEFRRRFNGIKCF
jgi:hypothetical protein